MNSLPVKLRPRWNIEIFRRQCMGDGEQAEIELMEGYIQGGEKK